MDADADAVSGTPADWRHPSLPTKQAEEPMSAIINCKDPDTALAANAGTGDGSGSGDPQPTAQSEAPGGLMLRAAGLDDVTGTGTVYVAEGAGADLPPSANATAALDGSGLTTDELKPTIADSHGQQAGVGVEDVLPPGRQVMLILVGLVASGKSTFAQALERHFPQFRRCSQDELGDRRSVEALARQTLGEGLSVVIDRTNFDESQRATWIRIGREVPGTLVWVMVFDTPYEVCAARLKNRTGHPTITTPELGLEVLENFQSLFRPPVPHEGYSRILYLKPADLPPTPELNAQDVQGILRRLQATPEVVQPNNLPMQDRAYSGRGWRGSYNRGYGDSRGDRGGYQPRGFATRGAPVHRGDWAPRGGYWDGYRGEGTSRTRGSGSFYSSDGRASSPGWRGQSSAPRGSSGHYPNRSGQDVSDRDRTERDWRR